MEIHKLQYITGFPKWLRIVPRFTVFLFAGFYDESDDDDDQNEGENDANDYAWEKPVNRAY